MAGNADSGPFLRSAEPFTYSAPAGPTQTSPHKLNKISNSDARKHGDKLKDTVALDRPLLGASSMGHTILIDFETFENDILGVKPSLTADQALPEELVDHARLVFDKLFSHGASPLEIKIAEEFIKVINAETGGSPLSRHKAAFTGNHTSTDGTPSKVDAGLYSNEQLPVTMKPSTGKLTSGKPDWNNIRLFIEFKRKNTSLDPFDDYEPDDPEASAQTRQAVREQIINYALDIRNRQHRTCIYALLIIGPEFRLMRFDQSGIIVTKKKNYAEDPSALLSFLAWFDKVSPEQQGYDQTATLLKEGSRAYKLMDEFGLGQASDMEHAEGSEVPATYTPPQPEAEATTVVEPARSPYNTRQKTKAALAALSNDDETYLDEIELDDEDPRVFKYVREKFGESLEEGWPRYKLEVGEEKRIFLVGKPIWTASWLFGRGTRGYIALDVKKRRFVFLKDCWRPFYVGIKSEGAYLEILNPGGTNATDVHVPTLVTHGDVAGQITMTAQYANYRAAQAKRQKKRRREDDELPQPSASGGAKEGHITPSVSAPAAMNVGNADGPSSENDGEAVYRHFTHYRIVTKDVCLPFTEITSSKQLVVLLFDCVTAHSFAYTDHRLLHRDVSAGNVIIRPSLSSDMSSDDTREVMWEGVLTDWELAKEIPVRDPSKSETPKEVPRQPERTGTWQFMSVAYVENHPNWPVTVADELESFFHVLLFYAVRLFRHNISNVSFFVADYFDKFTVSGDVKRRCSIAKKMAMNEGIIKVSRWNPLQFKFPDGQVHTDLNDLLNNLLQYFKARYEVLAWESRKSQVTPRPSDAPASPAPSQPSFGMKRLQQFGKYRQVDVGTAQQAEGEPSDETKACAKQLDGHSVFIANLVKAVDPGREATDRAPVWPEMDVVPERRYNPYDPRVLASMANKMYTPSAGATTTTDPDGAPARKKHRTGDVSEPTQVSIPPQPTRAGTVSGSLGMSLGDP
ncbi:hypothetical protein ACG7TL_007882 [Trametes sanguinea]